MEHFCAVEFACVFLLIIFCVNPYNVTMNIPNFVYSVISGIVCCFLNYKFKHLKFDIALLAVKFLMRNKPVRDLICS